MRTTVDLPEDLHRIVTSLASHTRRSLSQTAADLMRRGLAVPARTRASSSSVRVDAKTGLPVLHGPRAITPEDVKALEDES
jgi:negative regulator of replication initiation